MGNGMNPGGYVPSGGMHSPSGHNAGSQRVRKGFSIFVKLNAITCFKYCISAVRGGGPALLDI